MTAQPEPIVRPLRGCELAHQTFHDARQTRYALHPIVVTRPATGSTMVTLRCPTCRRALRATVDSRRVWWPRRTGALLGGRALVLLGLTPFMLAGGLILLAVSRAMPASAAGCPCLVLAFACWPALGACGTRASAALHRWNTDFGIRLDKPDDHRVRRRGSSRQRHPQPPPDTQGWDFNPGI